MRTVRTLVLGISSVFAAVVPAFLGAQAFPVAVDASRYDVMFGLSMSTTGAVNRKPTCTNVGLPCETSGREFPDFGFVLTGAMHETPYVAVVSEASLYFNVWDTAGVSGATVPRTNRVGALQPGIGFYGPLHRPRDGERTEARFLLGWDYRWTYGQLRNLSGSRYVLAVSVAGY